MVVETDRQNLTPHEYKFFLNRTDSHKIKTGSLLRASSGGSLLATHKSTTLYNVFIVDTLPVVNGGRVG
jgi:hypothetical protein